MIESIKYLFEFLKGRKPAPGGERRLRSDGYWWIKTGKTWKREKKGRAPQGAKNPKPEKEKKPRAQKLSEGGILRDFDHGYAEFIKQADPLIRLFEHNYSERMSGNVRSAKDVDMAVAGLRTIADDYRNALNHAKGAMVERIRKLPKTDPLWQAMKEKRSVQLRKFKEYDSVLSDEMRLKILNASDSLRRRLFQKRQPAGAFSQGIMLMPEYQGVDYARPMYSGAGSLDRDAAASLGGRKPPSVLWKDRYVESTGRINGSFWIGNGRLRLNATMLPRADRSEIQRKWYGPKRIITKKDFIPLCNQVENDATLPLTYHLSTGRPDGNPRHAILSSGDGQEVALDAGITKFLVGIDPNVKFLASVDDEGTIRDEIPLAIYGTGDRMIGIVQPIDADYEESDVIHRVGQKVKADEEKVA